jgi:hypothetical protein
MEGCFSFKAVSRHSIPLTAEYKAAESCSHVIQHASEHQCVPVVTQNLDFCYSVVTTNVYDIFLIAKSGRKRNILFPICSM